MTTQSLNSVPGHNKIKLKLYERPRKCSREPPLHNWKHIRYAASYLFQVQMLFVQHESGVESDRREDPVMAGDEDTRLTMEYISQMNEPKTVQEITEGLGGRVAPHAVEKALESLTQGRKVEARLLKTEQVKIFWKCRDAKECSTTPASSAKRPFQRTRLPFKSPARTEVPIRGVPTTQATGPSVEPPDELERVKLELREVEAEIMELSRDFSEVELQRHIDKLHEYNEMKDVGQMLIGRLAELQGTTTTALYGRFGLGVED